jgi:hypothetical protein
VRRYASSVVGALVQEEVASELDDYILKKSRIVKRLTGLVSDNNDDDDDDDICPVCSF